MCEQKNNPIRINYVTNLPISQRSGGGSGVNFAAHSELKRNFNVEYIGPINPPQFFHEKVVAKVKRTTMRNGAFFFFSENRLLKIAEEYRVQVQTSIPDYTFFHGGTPWVKCAPNSPYGIFTDACFATYMDIYHQKEVFSSKDLQRIYDLEKNFYEKAKHVFFRTKWALAETVKHYQISADNLHTVGVGGFMPIPEEDYYEGGKYFLFISLNFAKKGGNECFQAFKQVVEKYPDYQLKIIGQKPPEEALHHPNVEYVGFINKSDDDELKEFIRIYANAFALVHPTSMDTNALVLTEAGYHGCPSISTRRFGIPELIVDGQTGFLVDAPIAVDDLAQKMLSLCQDNQKYLDMRKAVRAYTTQNYTWDRVGNHFKNFIEQSL